MIRKKYCGTAAKAGGNGENKPRPHIMGVPCLLEKPMEPDAKYFFDGLIIMQLVLVTGVGLTFMRPLAVIGFAFYLPLDVLLVFSRARIMLQTVARRLLVVLICVVVPLVIAFGLEETGLAPWLKR